MTLQRRYLPDMKTLVTFEAAARHGNFTRAGEELSLTQSAVSRQMRDLEDQIGKPLFERVRGRVVTTPAGNAFLKEVVQLLRQAETTMRHVTAGAQGETVLSINALPTFAMRWLLPRIPGFLAQHPGTRFDITTRRDVFDFETTQCDLAIHYGQPIWPGAICTYLCSEVVLPVVGGALRDRRLTGPQDLTEAPKIHLTERPGLWSDWFEEQGMTLNNANEGHWFDQFSLSIEAVKSGLGYALVPGYLIETELRSGEIKVALDIPFSTDNAYYIAVPEGRSEQIRTFRDWLIGAVSFRPMA